MVVKRKKTTIDGMDREILRAIMQSRRKLTGNQISQKVKLTPSAIRPRLDNLRRKGIVKPLTISGMRSFRRSFQTNKGLIQKRVKSPRSITWGIDLKKPQKNIPRKATPIQLKNLASGRKILAKKRRR